VSETRKIWPKVLPPLSPAQAEAREKFMLQWQHTLPVKYGMIEKFNQGWVTTLPLKDGCRTLEVGAGTGAHLVLEDLTRQDYYALEYREKWCGYIRKLIAPERVICGDIQQRQAWPDKHFDRVVGIHVLEHLADLPAALKEIGRLLKDDGKLDVILPCEGRLAYGLGRKISAERQFRRDFKMDYGPIVRHEHINTLDEVLEELELLFESEVRRMYPFPWLPSKDLNLALGMRMKKRPAGGAR
jgi:SAM-dependent methyltransferase